MQGTDKKESPVMSIHLCRYFRRFGALTALAAPFFLLSAAGAQSLDLPDGASGSTREIGAGGADAVSIDPEAGDQKLPIERVQPYSTWKHHVAAKPEEALVSVRYAAPGGAPITATGLVVRCDGFVLVPRVVRDVARSGGSVQVTLRYIDGAESAKSGSGASAPTPVTVAARPHPRTHATVPYALVKTNGHHARSLPLLDSANVRTGTPVRLVWFAAEPGGSAEIISRNGVIGAATEARDTFAITPTGGSGSGAGLIPSGAVVLDTESGGALGFVTQEGTVPAFTTLARFSVIASEVGLAPDRAAVRLGDRSGTLPSETGEMVFVPGGPVPLDGTVARDYTRDYDTTVACTPGFWMAVQPVTNGEYGRWLGTQKVRRLPFGWKPAEVQGATDRREDRPAVGMLVEDAAFYATSRRSRLPTDVEWRRAAYSRDTTWVEEMNQDWDRAGQQVALLFERQQQRVAELMAQAEEAALQRIPPPTQAEMVRTKGGSSFLRPKSRPPVVRSNTQKGIVLAPTAATIDDSLSIQQFTSEFLQGQWRWGQVSPVDSFRQDVSIFGVRNVLINAPEYVQGSIQQTQYAPKLYPAHVDPDLSQFYWGETSSPKVDRTGWRGFEFTKTGKIDYREAFETRSDDTQQKASAEVLRRMLLGSFMIRYWRGGEANWQGAVSVVGEEITSTRSYHQGDPIELHPDRVSLNYRTTFIRAGFRTDVRAGFRCAR